MADKVTRAPFKVLLPLWVSQGHSSPQDFLELQQDLEKHYSKSLQALHDCFHSNVNCTGLGEFGPLSELFVDGFNDDQVWEEIQLTNGPFFEFLKQRVRKMATWRGHLCVANPDDGAGDSDDVSENDISMGETLGAGRGRGSVQFAEEVEVHEEEATSEGSYLGDEEESPPHAIKMATKRGRSAVDDRFFKLAEMQEFLDSEDRKEEATTSGLHGNHIDDSGDSDDDDAVDYFEDIPSDEEAGAVHYTDFFDPPGNELPHGSNEYDYSVGDDEMKDDEDEASVDSDSKLRVGSEGLNELEVETEDEDEDSIREDDDDDEAEGFSGVVSSHEERLARMKRKVKALEEHSIADKPWQLSGEASERLRPENSLLQDHLDFDHTSQPAPAITEEMTHDLESIIMQRIKDESWDDVERKLKPKEKPYNYRVTRPLDQEKSARSLAEVYEEEYLREMRGKEMREGAGEEEEGEENEKHVEIRRAMERLFAKLDALSNFHFTPKPLKEDIKVVTNVPTISMEEVTPVAVNDRELLAPQEVEKEKAFAVGMGERSLTDKKRARRQWKKRAHFMSVRRSQKEALLRKLHPGSGKQSSKDLALKTLDKARNVTVAELKRHEHKRIVKTSTQMFAELQEKTSEWRATPQQQKKTLGSGEKNPSIALKL